ncbi:MAG: tetratricopeptide repeat-containing protein kinase family protein, partial [Chthoniobacter sp.]|uniref:tetratricopeptide repeat-containing protein kinase family protein n=1 Tax=Chthoniobacter sp. TaxID=2510640 RepID=UPI0032AA99D1
SNILVTLHDGVPVPKVIDFGVAKATQQRLTDLTLFTQFEQMIGTPLYMSPEQAEMSGLDIDTRTDIYALGVLLYELLTGRTPFDPKELLKRGLDEIRRAIREQEPPRPSTALSTMAAAAMTAVAQNRRSDSAKLIGLLRGDLDWIVMKALEKNRTRRYDTANAFAEDIQRHLASEPVVACPPSFGYTAGKFIRKHKGPVMTAALVALALIAGLAASTVLYQREKSALAVAESSRAKAETSTQTAMSEAAKSAQMANFLAEMFRRMDAAKGQDITLMKAMLDEASKRATELQDQPAVEAQLRQTIGGAYLALGLTGEAQQQFDLYRMLQQRVPESEYLNSIKAMREQARLYWQDGKPALAETLCRQILDISQRVLGPDHPETLAAMTDLAWAYVQAGKSDEAVHLYRKKLQIANDARGPTHIDTLQALDDLAFHSMGSGKYADALPLYVQLLERAKRTLEPGHPLIFQTTSQLDFVYAQLGMYAEEEPMALAAYAGIRKYEDSGGHAPMTTTQGTVLLHDTLLRLVNLYNALAKPDEAAKWQQKLDAYDQAAAARKNSTPADAAPAKP